MVGVTHMVLEVMAPVQSVRMMAIIMTRSVDRMGLLVGLLLQQKMVLVVLRVITAAMVEMVVDGASPGILVETHQVILEVLAAA